MSGYLSIPTFFIIFRETVEAAIIVSVLLSFLRQVLSDDHVMRKRLSRQVNLRLEGMRKERFFFDFVFVCCLYVFVGVVG